MLPIYEYNGTLAGNLLENTDVVNALTSSDTTKPLSAAQGKALNDKILKILKINKNITSMRYATKVFQLEFNNGFQNLYSKAQLMEMLGLSGTIDKFNEKIYAYCINGDWNSNNAYFSALSFDSRTNYLIVKIDNAIVGPCRLNFLIVYSEEGEISS